MKVYEIYKKTARDLGGIANAIEEQYFVLWDNERIRTAFNFGAGTEKDFRAYKENNKNYCHFVTCND